MNKSCNFIAAILAATVITGVIAASTPALAGYQARDTGHRWALVDAPTPVINAFPPGYVGYLCVETAPVYDQWGQVVGFQRLVVGC